MTKEYDQQLSDLQSGLNMIKEKIKKCPDRKGYELAKLSKDIQEARIDGFKMGYKLRNKEIKEQRNL